MASKAEELKQKLRPKPKPELTGDDWLSTGSTLVNLACSGHPKRGLLKGYYYLLVGDSDSGKTWLAHNVIAEACRSKVFADHRMIYDNPEQGALFDLEKYFGKDTARRMEPPTGTKSNPIYSETVEEFYFCLDGYLDKGPVIWVEDSMDCLGSEAAGKKFSKQKQAHDQEKETKGSYGTDKAKANSSNLPRILYKLKQTGSILIIISQTRDNIGFGSQFNPKTRSGGKSLSFYATLEFWTAKSETLKRTVLGKSRQVGITSQIRVKRNRVTGKDRTIEIPVLHSFGIDDIGSMVDWLIEEKHWDQKDRGTIIAPEFGLELGRERLVEKIEESNQENELRALVTKVWAEIEEACVVQRKKRYV